MDSARLWLLLGLGLAAAVLYFLAYRNEYHKTYTVAYSESEKIRLEVAEHIRRLPLSFFNNKDLSELTTNMMADCTSVEHTMSHVAPGLFADVITALLTCALLALYDWRMSLDPENEALIQEAISELVKNRTGIVIAHRLRTVLGADKIAVLDRGRLAEEGSGEELLAKDGLFARLYRIQQESLGWTAGQKH
ncbi:MAG: hypothetical protein LBQ38_01105 [Spirochaetaceae bacterium]|nr:hypothetical protein [Spirochaetaceae bacterium]